MWSSACMSSSASACASSPAPAKCAPCAAYRSRSCPCAGCAARRGKRFLRRFGEGWRGRQRWRLSCWMRGVVWVRIGNLDRPGITGFPQGAQFQLCDCGQRLAPDLLCQTPQLINRRRKSRLVKYCSFISRYPFNRNNNTISHIDSTSDSRPTHHFFINQLLYHRNSAIHIHIIWTDHDWHYRRRIFIFWIQKIPGIFQIALINKPPLGRDKATHSIFSKDSRAICLFQP